MKLWLLLTFCAFLVVHGEPESKDCKNECNETEYHAYVDCIRKRMKRSTDCNSFAPCENCEEGCQECDCDYCAVNPCQQSCNNCCPNNPPCSTNRCCHKTCHARCKSSTCRSECRRTCSDKISGGGVNITTGEKARHNITTVINLRNVINNTNVIDIPVQVNNTNVNDITLSSSDESSMTGGQVGGQTCCYVVSPRQCLPTEKYPYVRCFHYRRKVCGQFCRAPIVHEQPHEICDQTATGTNCHQQIVYIPQPQPRCAYQSNWPYVSCGIPQQQFCGGCYAHYNSPYPQMPPPGCAQGCYDDGYGAGPYYRQGPFYRPGYSHAPSCYQIGSCDMYGGYGGYFGAGYGGAYGGGYGAYGGYGGYGYPTAGYNGYSGFPGVGYPPSTYENSIHFETDPSNVSTRPNKETNQTSDRGDKIDELPAPSYYPLPLIPQYNAVGYPFPSPGPPYKLPPEVDIQATITHPEKESRYAKISIENQNKRESKGIADEEKEEKEEKEKKVEKEEKEEEEIKTKKIKVDE